MNYSVKVRNNKNIFEYFDIDHKKYQNYSLCIFLSECKETEKECDLKGKNCEKKIFVIKKEKKENFIKNVKIVNKFLCENDSVVSVVSIYGVLNKRLDKYVENNNIKNLNISLEKNKIIHIFNEKYLNSSVIKLHLSFVNTNKIINLPNKINKLLISNLYRGICNKYNKIPVSIKDCRIKNMLIKEEIKRRLDFFDLKKNIVENIKNINNVKIKFSFGKFENFVDRDTISILENNIDNEDYILCSNDTYLTEEEFNCENFPGKNNKYLNNIVIK